MADQPGGSSHSRETEIKLRVASAGEGRRRLNAAGFRLARRRAFEANTVFDTPDGRLRSARRLLRLRQTGRRWMLTFKGAPEGGKHKSREEIEAELAGPGAIEGILARLGYIPVFRYEKYRTEYSRDHGLATLDETPIGVFLELEGAPGWIDRLARRLGFSESDYVTASYGRLYLDHCRAAGHPPGHMVFPRRR